MLFKPSMPTQHHIKAFIFALLMGVTFYGSSAYALEVNIATMIENLSKTIPNLMQFVTAFAYVLGMFFIFRGILELKQYGESRTMMSTQQSLTKPLLVLFVGAALLYLPSSVWVGLSTFWSNPSPYAYVKEGNDPWWTLIKSILMIIELVGVIAFIRGLVILTQLGSHPQPGTFSRAMAHMVGGILCINMYGFVQAIMNTLALGQI